VWCDLSTKTKMRSHRVTWNMQAYIHLSTSYLPPVTAAVRLTVTSILSCPQARSFVNRSFPGFSKSAASCRVTSDHPSVHLSICPSFRLSVWLWSISPISPTSKFTIKWMQNIDTLISDQLRPTGPLWLGKDFSSSFLSRLNINASCPRASHLLYF